MINPVAWPNTPPLALPAYFAWAYVQEFAVQNIVVAGLVAVGLPRGVIPPVVGAAFAAAHLPVLPLAVLAGAAGIAWTWLYLRYPNLWAVGATHAVVGFLAFVLVLGKNPVGGFYGTPV